jgi:hypothetical protein
MRGAAYPMYWKGRQIWGRRGRQVGRYKPDAKTAGERMTFRACLRLAKMEQPGRGLTYVLR